VSGASPGIVMKAHPKAGDFYRQEFLLNTAEDSAGVLNVNQTVRFPQEPSITALRRRRSRDWSQARR